MGSLSDHSKAGKAACQAHKHAQAKNATAIGGYKACSSLSKKWFLPSIIHCVPSELPLTLACGAYVGIKCPQHEKLYTVDELLAKGFRLISWDGVMPIALVDRDGHMVVMLAGQLAGDSWVEAVKTAMTMLLAMQVKFVKQGENMLHHHRTYAFIGTGVSFGGGGTDLSKQLKKYFLEAGDLGQACVL